MCGSMSRIFVKKQCADCPFHKRSPLNGSADWFVDVMRGWKNDNLDHTCHVTDPKADGYKGGTKKQCIGFLGLQKIEDHVVSQEALSAMATGELEWCAVSTDGIYRFEEMVLAYAKKYKLFGAQKLRQLAWAIQRRQS